MLKIHELTKSYGAREILSGLSFEIPLDGSVYGVFGPNGAGVWRPWFIRKKPWNGCRKVLLRDVDRDGDTDLLLLFRIRETGIAFGDTEVWLTGTTYAGRDIIGSDSIKTVGCGKK